MIRKLVLIYLIMVFFFAWGYAAIQYQLFPGKLLVSMETLVKSKFLDKPEKAAAGGGKKDSPITLEAQLAEFIPSSNRAYQEIEIEVLKERRNGPLVFSDSGNITDGYRFIYGTFDFDQHLHGAILLDSSNRVIHHWAFDESSLASLSNSTLNGDNEPTSTTAPELRWPHGIAIFADGSIIATDDNRGRGMFRVNLCGEFQWIQSGHFNNIINVHPDGKGWSIRDDSIIELDPTTGEVIREISLNDIHLANPDIAVFTPRRSLRVSKWYHDPVHLNDIEPLPEEYSSSFPMFTEGDLLLSYRSLNLIAVLDPESLKIKWWRTGISQRQHDVDWQKDGTISVYDNNQRDNPAGVDNRLPEQDTRYSQILTINPASMEVEVVFNGKEENLYNSRFGSHQILPGGNILISSPEQGRVIEVSREGKTVFEFVNRFNENQALKISEAIWLPPDFFSVEFGENLDCGV